MFVLLVYNYYIIMGLNNIINNIKILKLLVLSDIFILGKRLKYKYICNILIK